MSKSLVVLGGTGFLGKHICTTAAKAGWKVVSLSSSGSGGGSRSVPDSSVAYKQANVFEPETYRETLQSATAVVHSMGTIFDNSSYKQQVNGSPSLCNLMGLVRERFIAQDSNPMERANRPRKQSGFDRLNRESAIILAKEFSKVNQKRDHPSPFVYISAEDWNPLADRRYVQSKRQAESELERIEGLRPVFIRPGFMYDSNDGPADSLRGVFGTVARLSPVQVPAIPVQLVAKAAVEALDDSSLEGVIALDALKLYGSYA